MIRNDRAWLCIYVAVVLAFPMALGYTTLERPEFDPAPIERLREERPEVVLIGDSMLDSRIDTERLEALTGKRVSRLMHHGSASGLWYLYLKNYVAASGLKPVVIVFFRDRYLTDPTFRLGGGYLKNVYPAMHVDEPVVGPFIDKDERGAFGWFENLLDSVYPSKALRDPVANGIVEFAQAWSQRVLPGEVDYEDEVDDTFDIRRLRKDMPSDLGSTNLSEKNFRAALDESFLPEMIELARHEDIELRFFRVKRRPDASGRREQSASLEEYIRTLRAYLDEAGVEMRDETKDVRIGLELYGDGDHIDRERRERYTELFFDEYGGLLK